MIDDRSGSSDSSSRPRWPHRRTWGFPSISWASAAIWRTSRVTDRSTVTGSSSPAASEPRFPSSRPTNAARATGLVDPRLVQARSWRPQPRDRRGRCHGWGPGGRRFTNPVSPIRREPRLAGLSAFAVAAPMAWRRRRGAARGTQSSVQVLVPARLSIRPRFGESVAVRARAPAVTRPSAQTLPFSWRTRLGVHDQSRGERPTPWPA